MLHKARGACHGWQDVYVHTQLLASGQRRRSLWRRQAVQPLQCHACKQSESEAHACHGLSSEGLTCQDSHSEPRLPGLKQSRHFADQSQQIPSNATPGAHPRGS